MMAMIMVSARVPEDQHLKAQQVLREKGMTFSDLVRVVVEYVSDTGEVPDLEAMSEELRRERRKKEFEEAMRYLEEHPVVGIGNRDAKELLNEARDERFGLS